MELLWLVTAPPRCNAAGTADNDNSQLRHSKISLDDSFWLLLFESRLNYTVHSHRKRSIRAYSSLTKTFWTTRIIRKTSVPCYQISTPLIIRPLYRHAIVKDRVQGHIYIYIYLADKKCQITSIAFCEPYSIERKRYIIQNAVDSWCAPPDLWGNLRPSRELSRDRGTTCLLANLGFTEEEGKKKGKRKRREEN